VVNLLAGVLQAFEKMILCIILDRTTWDFAGL
jgi:hypothetical protein